MGWHCLLKEWLKLSRHLANILQGKHDVLFPKGGYLFFWRKTMCARRKLFKNFHSWKIWLLITPGRIFMISMTSGQNLDPT